MTRPAPRSLAALAALLLPAAAAAAPELSVSPRALRLAEGGRATIRVASPGGAPAVAASAGRVEGLREVAAGIWEAEYVPPETLDPQVALLSAVTPGGFAWARLPLAGVRELEVRAPHRTPVSVLVDGQAFGPVPANGLGRAVLRVDVPPGARVATAGALRLDLGVQARGFSHVVLDRAALDANEAGAVALRALATSPRGAPLARAAPRLQVSEGEVGPAVEVEPGVYEARWSLAPGPVRRASVTARFGAADVPPATASLERVPGPARAVRIEVAPEALVAGEGDELRVAAQVVDAAGNPTDAPARLVVALGAGPAARPLAEAVVDWRRAPDGWSGRVLVPRQRSGRQELELRVLAPGGLSGARTVPLLPGAPAAVTVEADEELLADGRGRRLRISLLDGHGNRAEAAAPPTLAAARGDVGPPARVAPGVYEARYRAPLAAADFLDPVTARAGPVEGRSELRVRARGGAVVLGPRAGWVLGSGGLASPTAGAELGLWTRPLRASLGLALGVHWFAFSRDDDVQVGERPVRLRSEATFVALDATLGWRRPLWGGMAWAGAGAGAVHGTSRVATDGQPDLTGEAWAPSAHASLAWGAPLGPGLPYAELRLGWQGDAGDAPVRGAMQTLTLAAGYRLDVL